MVYNTMCHGACHIVLRRRCRPRLPRIFLRRVTQQVLGGACSCRRVARERRGSAQYIRSSFAESGTCPQSAGQRSGSAYLWEPRYIGIFTPLGSGSSPSSRNLVISLVPLSLNVDEFKCKYSTFYVLPLLPGVSQAA